MQHQRPLAGSLLLQHPALLQLTQPPPLPSQTTRPHHPPVALDGLLLLGGCILLKHQLVAVANAAGGGGLRSKQNRKGGRAGDFWNICSAAGCEQQHSDVSLLLTFSPLLRPPISGSPWRLSMSVVAALNSPWMRGPSAPAAVGGATGICDQRQVGGDTTGCRRNGTGGTRSAALPPHNVVPRAHLVPRHPPQHHRRAMYRGSTLVGRPKLTHVLARHVAWCVLTGFSNLLNTCLKLAKNKRAEWRADRPSKALLYPLFWRGSGKLPARRQVPADLPVPFIHLKSASQITGPLEPCSSLGVRITFHRPAAHQRCFARAPAAQSLPPMH